VDGQDHNFFGPCFLIVKDCVVPMWQMLEYEVLGGQDNNFHTFV
jgi:hypothetical protein